MLSLFISSPTLVAMRVSEYFTPLKLVHCRIILRVDLKITGLIRKWRVLMVVVTQYVIPLTIAITFYTLCIKKILSRQRIGSRSDEISLLSFWFKLIGFILSGECTDQQEIKFYQSKMRTIKMLVLSLSAFAIGNPKMQLEKVFKWVKWFTNWQLGSRCTLFTLSTFTSTRWCRSSATLSLPIIFSTGWPSAQSPLTPLFTSTLTVNFDLQPDDFAAAFFCATLAASGTLKGDHHH